METQNYENLTFSSSTEVSFNFNEINVPDVNLNTFGSLSAVGSEMNPTGNETINTMTDDHNNNSL